MGQLEISEIQALIELRDMATKEKLEHRKKANEWAKKARELEKIITENSYDKELKEWNKIASDWALKDQDTLNQEIKKAG